MNFLVKLFGGYTKEEYNKMQCSPGVRTQREEKEKKLFLLMREEELHKAHENIRERANKMFSKVNDTIEWTRITPAFHDLLKALHDSDYAKFSTALVDITTRLHNTLDEEDTSPEANDVRDYIQAVFEVRNSHIERNIDTLEDQELLNKDLLESNLNVIKKSEKYAFLADEVSTLELTSRAFNALERNEKLIVGQIAILSEDEVSLLSNVGEKTVADIIGALHSKNLTLGMEFPEEIQTALRNYDIAAKIAYKFKMQREHDSITQ